MYGIFTYIYHRFKPHIGKYSIHSAHLGYVKDMYAFSKLLYMLSSTKAIHVDNDTNIPSKNIHRWMILSPNVDPKLTPQESLKNKARPISRTKIAISSWWFQPNRKIWFKMGSSSPIFGVKIKHIWNHHLAIYVYIYINSIIFSWA